MSRVNIGSPKTYGVGGSASTYYRQRRGRAIDHD
jgi:hypothetical protein